MNDVGLQPERPPWVQLRWSCHIAGLDYDLDVATRQYLAYTHSPSVYTPIEFLTIHK